MKLDSKAWHGHSTESLWAEPTGKAAYRVLNIPFFAKGLSFGDIVKADEGTDGRLEFKGVQIRSGNSTCRLVSTVSTRQSKSFASVIKRLKGLGCEYERGESGDKTIYAVSIPPQTKINDVVDALESREGAGLWDWEAGFDAHGSK